MQALNTRRSPQCVIATFCALASCAATPAATRYVNVSASGANDGSSWANAYTDLQTALSNAQPGDEIWVAAAAYKPAPPNGNRSVSFQLRNAIATYGGFNGTETSLDQRNFITNVTTLSGDLNGDDGPNFANNGENSFH